MSAILCPWLLLVSLSANTGVDVAQQQIILQSALRGELEAALSGVLPHESFVVMVAVKLKSSTRREVIEGERVQRRGRNRSQLRSDLPGLAPVARSSADLGGSDRRLYRDVTTTDVHRVEAQLILDEDLATPSVQVAGRVVRQMLRANFPGKAHVTVSRVKLIEPKPPQPPAPETTVATPAVDWWLLVLGLLVGLFLAMLLWLWRRARMARPARHDRDMTWDEPSFLPVRAASPLGEEVGPRALPAPAQASLEVSVQLSEAVASFVREVVEEPLVTRRFIARLSPETWSRLLTCFETDSLREALAELAGPLHGSGWANKDENQAPAPVGERTDWLVRLRDELADYRRLAQIQLQQRFGFLAFLTVAEIRRLFDTVSLRGIATILQHCNRDTGLALTSSLSPTVRARLIDIVLDTSETTTPEVGELEEYLRTQVAELERRILTPFAEHRDLLGVLLEGAEQQKGELESLLSARPALRSQFAHLLVGFDDFLTLDLPKKGEVLESLSNEDIALVTCTLETTQRGWVLAALPEGRRKVVEGLAQPLHNTAPTDRKERSRRRLVDRFRRLTVQRRITQ